MATSSPLLVSLSLQQPVGPGLPLTPFPVEQALSFTQRVETDLAFSGTGTHTLSLGTLESGTFKVLYVSQDDDVEGEVVTLTFNGAAAGMLSIPPGGYVLLSLPVAQTTPSIEIAYTTSAVVRVRAYG